MEPQDDDKKERVNLLIVKNMFGRPRKLVGELPWGNEWSGSEILKGKELLERTKTLALSNFCDMSNNDFYQYSRA